jgi:hypothetical protein
MNSRRTTSGAAGYRETMSQRKELAALNLLPVLLLSVLSLTACSKQGSQPEVSKTPQPAVSQESKHGYELAKTWDDATVEARITEADKYYISGLVRFGKTDLQLKQLDVDRLNYRLCVREAHLEAVCKVPVASQTAKADCADANKLIDDLPNLIEKQNATLKEELKR